MRRREFIGALILAVRLRLGRSPASRRCWFLDRRGHRRSPGGGMRRIGALLALLENDLMGQTRAKALVEALGALNWKEGDNLRIDWRWAVATPLCLNATPQN